MGNTSSKFEELIKDRLRGKETDEPLIKLKNKNQTFCKKPLKPLNQKIIIDNSNGLPLQLIKSKEAFANEKLIVEGSDRRKKVSSLESSQWPFTCIGKIKGICNGEEFFGTGTLIGPNLVLTCAHNVYDLESKKEHYNLEFIPALNDGNFKQQSKVVKFKFPDEYAKFNIYDENQYLYDYALLFLEKNFEDYYGYLGIKDFKENETHFQVSLYGYSGGDISDNGKNMVGMTGSVKLKESFYCYSEIDTLGGQSGSALFKKDGEEYLIAGIHVCGAGHSNQAVKINSERILNIMRWANNETYATNLNLISNQIGDEGLKHLSAMNLPQLQELYLTDNRIGPEGMKYFSTMNLPLLQLLYIGINLIGVEGIKSLSTMNLPLLQELNLSFNQIGAEGIKHLSTMNLPLLHTLYLSRNKIGAEGIKHLSTMNLPQLKILYLSRNKIGNEGIKHLSAMNLQNLPTLYLSRNKITDEGIKHLSTMNLPELQFLYLNRNKIGNEGIKLLSTMNLLLLQTLNLSENQIGNEGIKHLSTMNSLQLQSLYLDKNLIGNEEIQKFKSLKPNLNIY